jgi:predicted Zn finger-like uncharacterized protein
MPIIVACPACGGKLRVADDLLGQRVRCPACQGTFDAARPPAPGAAAPPPLKLSVDDEPAPPAPRPAGPPGLVGAVELKLSLDDHGPAAPPPRPEPAPPPPERTPPPEGRRDDLRACPACGRQVHRDSRRCFHCGERLVGGERGLDGLPGVTIQGPVRRDCEPHRGPLVLSLGVLSLVMLSICYPIGAVLGLVAWVMGQSDLRKLKAGDMDPAGQGLTQAGWICGIIGTALNALITLGCAGFIGLIWYQETNRPRPRPTPPPAWQKQQPKWVNPPDDGP